MISSTEKANTTPHLVPQGAASKNSTIATDVQQAYTPAVVSSALTSSSPNPEATSPWDDPASTTRADWILLYAMKTILPLVSNTNDTSRTIKEARGQNAGIWKDIVFFLHVFDQKFTKSNPSMAQLFVHVTEDMCRKRWIALRKEYNQYRRRAKMETRTTAQLSQHEMDQALFAAFSSREKTTSTVTATFTTGAGTAPAFAAAAAAATTTTTTTTTTANAAAATASGDETESDEDDLDEFVQIVRWKNDVLDMEQWRATDSARLFQPSISRPAIPAASRQSTLSPSVSTPSSRMAISPVTVQSTPTSSASASSISPQKSRRDFVAKAAVSPRISHTTVANDHVSVGSSSKTLPPKSSPLTRQPTGVTHVSAGKPFSARTSPSPSPRPSPSTSKASPSLRTPVSNPPYPPVRQSFHTLFGLEPQRRTSHLPTSIPQREPSHGQEHVLEQQGQQEKQKGKQKEQDQEQQECGEQVITVESPTGSEHKFTEDMLGSSFRAKSPSMGRRPSRTAKVEGLQRMRERLANFASKVAETMEDERRQDEGWEEAAGGGRGGRGGRGRGESAQAHRTEEITEMESGAFTATTPPPDSAYQSDVPLSPRKRRRVATHSSELPTSSHHDTTVRIDTDAATNTDARNLVNGAVAVPKDTTTTISDTGIGSIASGNHQHDNRGQQGSVPTATETALPPSSRATSEPAKPALEATQAPTESVLRAVMAVRGWVTRPIPVASTTVTAISSTSRDDSQVIMLSHALEQHGQQQEQNQNHNLHRHKDQETNLLFADGVPDAILVPSSNHGSPVSMDMELDVNRASVGPSEEKGKQKQQQSDHDVQEIPAPTTTPSARAASMSTATAAMPASSSTTATTTTLRDAPTKTSDMTPSSAAHPQPPQQPPTPTGFVPQQPPSPPAAPDPTAAASVPSSSLTPSSSSSSSLLPWVDHRRERVVEFLLGLEAEMRQSLAQHHETLAQQQEALAAERERTRVMEQEMKAQRTKIEALEAALEAQQRATEEKKMKEEKEKEASLEMVQTNKAFQILGKAYRAEMTAMQDQVEKAEKALRGEIRDLRQETMVTVVEAARSMREEMRRTAAYTQEDLMSEVEALQGKVQALTRAVHGLRQQQ